MAETLASPVASAARSCVLCHCERAGRLLFSEWNAVETEQVVLLPLCQRCNAVLAGIIHILGDDAGKWQTASLAEVVCRAPDELVDISLRVRMDS